MSNFEKKKMSANSPPNSSDTSLSLSPDLLPEDNQQEKEQNSGASSISEHITSPNDSIENDRSFREIEISHIPNDLSQILRDHSSSEFMNISRETRPSLNSSEDTALTANSATKNVLSILEEILGNEQFKSQKSLKSDSYPSNDNSLNIFEGVNLDDSSINNCDYVLKLKASGDNDLSLNLDDDSEKTIENLKELLSAKTSVVAALSSELDSLKEGVSNQSTFSYTEYRQCQEECLNKIIEFKNALCHRDDIIEELKESLQKSLTNERELRADCERFAQDIESLQIELSQAVAYIKDHKCTKAEIQNVTLTKSSNSLETLEGQNKEVDETDLVSSSEIKKKKVVDLKNRGGDKVELTHGIVDSADSEVKESNSGTSLLNKDAKIPIVDPGAVDKNDGCELEDICSKLEDTLNPAQVVFFDKLKVDINNYIQRKIGASKELQDMEIKILKDKLDREKNEYSTEISRLRELLANVRCGSTTDIEDLRKELTVKYTKEMEELRMYYEKKCADMEKHYSDEVFSQQSRKMSSGSGTGSEPELASDLIFSSSIPPHLGGGGDPGTPLRSKDYTKSLNKSDLQTFKKHLEGFIATLNKYNLEKISDEDVDKLKCDLDVLDIKGLLKIDLSRLKNELQSMYNAELEILRDDYENKLDMVNVQHQERVKEIQALKGELEEARKNINCAVQEVAKSGEFELADIVKSYQTKLQEQVALAKCDILSALVNQIQMLTDNPCDESQWPEEFWEIRSKFTEKYEQEINLLKEEHEEEIAKLKEENLKAINGALERARRRSLKDDNGSEMEIIKERNSLRKKTSILRNLLSELLKYFTRCEDELNNTLVEELIKHGMTDSDLETNLSDSTKLSESTTSLSKRVHLTPNIEELIDLLENSNTIDSSDIHLRNELETCLDRLKSEANDILALTGNLKERRELAESNEVRVESLEERINSLTRQLITDSRIKEDLSGELTETRRLLESVNSERVCLERRAEELEEENRALGMELGKARDKIGELIECGRKEIISEGYGENGKAGLLQGGIVTRASLAELQERAKMLAAKSSVQADNPLLQLIEDLCREADRIVEDAGKEREDYLQQIESADKKLRATTQFLEEQAVEREQERDEAQRRIASFAEQLRERERDRSSYERISRENGDLSPEMNTCCRRYHEEIVFTVEQLESQMRDMSKLIEDSESRNRALDTERREAVEKIGFLRDIIRDLESQVELKTTAETELKDIIVKLQDVIKQQRETNDELTGQLEKGGGDSASYYREHIIKLEEEVGKLRLTSELAGNEGVLKQLQLQLHDVELNIDKATQDLEGLHSTISTTSCSSPSEEMSIRDQIRPQTPSSTLDESDIPLQQLARLKEKLIKHSRAEHAAIKRIHDLEMQLVTVKHEHDEIQNERDVLQEQLSEQLVLISSLQMRLDDQRIRSQHLQKQTNASLEVRIYDLENEIQNLHDLLHSKENLIKQLNKTIEQTNEILKEREQEIRASTDDSAIEDLQNQMDQLKNENDLLKAKIDSDQQNAQLLPGLVDNILADKNKDIETLRQKLSETEKQLDLYLSMSGDRKAEERGLISFVNLSVPDQMRTGNKPEFEKISTPLDGKNVISFETPEQMRREPKNITPDLTIEGFHSLDTIYPRRVNFEATPISEIERVGSPKFNFTSDAPIMKPNSTEILKSGEKRVQFKEDRLSEKLSELENFNKELEGLYKKEQEVGKGLRLELAEVKMHLMEFEKENAFLKEDSKRKDDMYFKIAKEKHDIEKKFEGDENKNQALENELRNLKFELDKLVTENAELKNNLGVTENAYKQLQINEEKLKADINEKVQKLNNENELNQKLQKEIKNKIQQNEELLREKAQQENLISELKTSISDHDINMQAVKEEILQKEHDLIKTTKSLEEQTLIVQSLRDEILTKESEFIKTKNLLYDRECELEILNEDITRYQNEIANFEAEKDQLKLAKQRKEAAEKDLEIVKLKGKMSDLQKEIAHLSEKDSENEKLKATITDLKKEIVHLQDFLNEKDKIIAQIKLDSESLKRNLETIKTKMYEDGNVFDLREKLEREKEVNARLRSELSEKVDLNVSIEDISEQVRKQLDDSANLDERILSALNSGGFEDDAGTLKNAYLREREENAELHKTIHNLELQLKSLQNRVSSANDEVKKIEAQLEYERKTNNRIQIEDANLVEQMRIKLEEAAENENEFEKILKEEKLKRTILETEIKELKLRKEMLSSSSSKTEYKSLPDSEMMRIKAEVVALNEEVGRLKKELKAAKKAKMEAEASFKYAKDMMSVRNQEVENAERHLRSVGDELLGVKEKYLEVKVELEQRNREVENSRELMADLEQEKLDMKVQMEAINQELQRLKEEKLLTDEANKNRNAEMSSSVPEKFLQKMKDLGDLVGAYIKENKGMTDNLIKLTDERDQLRDRIRELEDGLNMKIPFDDPTARANHLFGKYLRADSYRNALAWQKKYLIRLLATYQDFQDPFSTDPFIKFEPRKDKRPTKSKRIKFKSVVCVVIAICRMKYMVQRWHSGTRGAAYASLQRKFRTARSQQLPLPQHTQVTAQFQVGQPVSSQHFSSNRNVREQRAFGESGSHSRVGPYEIPPRTVTTPPTVPENLPPWSGFTPPSKEKGFSLRRYENPTTSTDNMLPLQTSEITKCLEKFDIIHQRLGLAFNNHNT